MKILNLYAGIGGSRKLWGDEHEITAVENNDATADVYQYFYPNDTVVRGDAHQYLLDHYKEFDFIWSSPPCPTHSRLNIPLHGKGYVRYPEMGLYQEIIFLKQWGGRDGRLWVVENVRPYYQYLIEPTTVIERHPLWANFEIESLELPSLGNLHNLRSEQLEEVHDIRLPAMEAKEYDRRLMLRDITRPEIGAHILKCAERVPANA